MLHAGFTSIMVPTRSALVIIASIGRSIEGRSTDGRSTDYPPGWNGLARTPPMGWRSWNAFGNRITQDMMLVAADALVAKNRTVGGVPRKSLLDAGYASVGVDEGWVRILHMRARALHCPRVRLC